VNAAQDALDVDVDLGAAEIMDVASRIRNLSDITGEAGNDPRSYRVDFSRLRRLLPGASVRHSILDGARELVAAYREYGMNDDIFNHRFVRLARIRELQESSQLDDNLRAVK